MKKRKLPKSLALFLAAAMTFSMSGALILASETQAVADEGALEAGVKSAAETQASAAKPQAAETPAAEAPAKAQTEVPATEAPAEAQTEAPATEAPAETQTESPATEAPAEAQTDAAESETMEYCVTFDSHAADYGKIVVDREPADVGSYKKQVLEKESFTFCVVPDEGYETEYVRVDGIDVPKTEQPGEYRLASVEKDTVITVTYRKIQETEDSASSQISQESGAYKAQINGGESRKEVDVRAGADGLSEILFTLPHGVYVTVLCAEGDWLKIEYEGQTGYVYKAGIFTDGAEAPEAEKAQPKATIFSSRRAVMEPGETVTLTSRLEYADGYEIRYQWECDRGAGFEAVEGANSDTYTFEADTQTLSYNWRLVVYYR